MADSRSLHHVEAGGTGAILVASDGRYLVQHRDDDSAVELAGHWGLFGGAIEPDESAEDAMRRELDEELALRVARIQPFVSTWVDLRPIVNRQVTKFYFEIALSDADIGALRPTEGQDWALVTYAEFADGRPVTPVDLMALNLHHNRRLMAEVLAPRRPRA